MSGRVVLVGAGPGDPDLLTVRAVRELERAEVLLYDALVDPLIIDLVPESCERIDVGKRGDGTRGIAQDAIAALLILHARRGRRVVRLKGGDPFVFARGGEEANALRDAGVSFEIVPGVTSAIAVPAYAGIPVTDRRLSSSFAVVTGHRGKEAVDRRIDWEGLAKSADTLVIMMGTTWLADIVARVIAAGRPADTPSAVIERGATPRQRVVSAPLRELPARVQQAGLRAPTVIVIGQVARLRERLAWYESLPLFGRRVLVPRARGQADELLLALRRRAAEPVCVPLLELAPPRDPDALAAALQRIDEYDWLVFSSANAVSRCSPAPGAAAKQRVRVACIGAATAAAARRAGLRVDLVPAGAALPQTLVAELARADTLGGRRVLLPQAERARPELARLLEAAGARVDAIAAYRTRMPDGAATALREALKQGIAAVTFTSPSTVEHFFSALAGPECDALAGKGIFACIGPTTAAALARFSRVEPVVAERQSSEGLVEVLERAFEEGRDAVS